MTQQTQGTIPWKVSNHYSLQGDSSEEDDLLPGQGFRGGYEDCVCCVCGETFTFLNNLIEHFRVHKGEVRCHLCQVTFTRAISLALHLENAHPNHRLYCESCKVLFWSTWHMNQHMGQHFDGKKMEPPNEKPLWLEVEEVMVKTEEVEINCVKEEEEEIPLAKLPGASESIFMTFTMEGQLCDHNYCQVKPVRVFNNSPNTEGSDVNTYDKPEEKVDIVVLRSLPQREGVSKTDRDLQQAPCETSRKARTDMEEMPSPSVSVPPKSEPEQLELNIKLEDDGDNDLLECAPLEDDAENAGVENVEIKEESDSSQHSSLYSPLRDFSSDTDTDSAFDMSTDYGSDSAEEGSVRLLRSRAVKKRRVHINTNENSVSPENACAVTEPSTSNCTPLSSIKISTSNENNLFSNYTCLSCLLVFPNQKTFMMHSCGKCKVGRTVSSSIARSTKEDLLEDHKYSSTNSVEEPIVSNQRHAQHTHSSAREQKENSEPVKRFNDDSETEDSEFECEQQESVEIVVLRSMPQIEGVTNTGRVVLQAAYEKVIKTQVRGRKPAKREEQETTNTKSSLSDVVSVKLEPEEKEVGIKVEDSVENSLWECAPIEEDLENIKEEENTEIKEESDNSIDIPLFSPVEDSSIETDEASGISTDDKRSDSLEDSSTRELQSRTVNSRPILTNTNDKPVTSVEAGTKLAILPSDGTLVNSVKVSAGPQSCTSKEKPINSVNPDVAPKCSSSKDLEMCSSCGLSKGACKGLCMKKPTEQCRSMQKSCYICRGVFASEQLLLKHQHENHPLTQYVCSTCVQVFPNQNSFAMHSCCKLNLPASTNVTPANNKTDVKNPPTMFVKFIRPPAVPGSSNQLLNNGGSQTSTIPSAFNFVVSNNVINIVDASQNLLPNNPCSTQTVPVQRIAPVTPNNSGSLNVASIALNGGQASVNPLSTVTLTNSGQMQVLIPSSSPATTKPNQTEIVFQGGVPSQAQQVLAANPVVPESLVSGTSAQGSNQSRVALRIPSYPSNSNKVSVSFSPTPVQFPTTTLVSAGSMKTLPSTTQKLPGLVTPFVVPSPKPFPAPPPPPPPPPASAPAPVCSSAPPLTRRAACLQSSITNLLGPCTTTISPDQATPLFRDPLSIVSMFVNQSQELALQTRLRQTWRSKSTFPCRHCGIIARQPSLGIRHRYQHRRPRLHKCQCGRTFEQRLHLLRHQVQHAEAVRYVCAACGQTFHGTHQLACHKHKVRLRSLQSKTKKLVRRKCRNLFNCDCGQGFTRSSALLWHMLKNSKSCKPSKKGSLASDLTKHNEQEGMKIVKD